MVPQILISESLQDVDANLDNHRGNWGNVIREDML